MKTSVRAAPLCRRDRLAAGRTGPNARHAISTPAEMAMTWAVSSQMRLSALVLFMMRPHCQRVWPGAWGVWWMRRQ